MLSHRSAIPDLSEHGDWLNLFNVIPDAVLITTFDEGRILNANPACEQVYRHKPSEMVDHTTIELGIFSSKEKRNNLLTSIKDQQNFLTEMVYNNGLGERRYGLFSGQHIRFQDQACLILIGRDITEFKINKQALNESIRRFYLLAESTNDIPWQINLDGEIEYIGPAIQQLGYKITELVTQDICELIHPDDKELFKERLRELQQNKFNTSHLHLRLLSKNNKKIINVEMTTIAEHDTFNNIIAIHGLMHDVSHYIEEKQELENIANQDELTRLFNRRYFFHYAIPELLQQKQETPIYCMLLDLDNFKQINDNHGHAIGDRVLKETARVLLQNLRSEDMVFRLGGDEFAALIHCSKLDDINIICQRLVDSVANIHIGSTDISASIGLCQVLPNMDENSLLEQADHAMYEAKRLGKNRYFIV